MSDPARTPSPDSLVAARRELHELAVLASALLRLATKVQARCDALRYTLGDVAPLGDDEIDRHAPRHLGAALEPGSARSEVADEDPAALLAMSLAGAGLSREQIGEYLQRSFGMRETDELLNRVLPDTA